LVGLLATLLLSAFAGLLILLARILAGPVITLLITMARLLVLLARLLVLRATLLMLRLVLIVHCIDLLGQNPLEPTQPWQIGSIAAQSNNVVMYSKCRSG
jgi:hypothetical protein